MQSALQASVRCEKSFSARTFSFSRVRAPILTLKYPRNLARAKPKVALPHDLLCRLTRLVHFWAGLAYYVALRSAVAGTKAFSR